MTCTYLYKGVLYSGRTFESMRPDMRCLQTSDRDIVLPTFFPPDSSARVRLLPHREDK